MTGGPRRAPSIPWLAVLALVWLVALMAGYYLGHKPFDADTARAVADAALDVVAVVVVVVLSGALGSLLLPFSHSVGASAARPYESAEALAVQALLGLGVLSLAIFGLVALSLIPPAWLAWLLTLLGVGALHRRALAWLRGLRDVLPDLTPGDRWTRFLASGVLALLGMALVAALAPPTKWDALVYHLTAPAAYLRGGTFMSGADNHFFGFPQAVELLYLWLMRLRGMDGTAAAPLHFAFGGLLLLLVFGSGRRLTGSAQAGWVASAVLLVSDSFWGEFAWPYVDLAAAAYTLAAFLVLMPLRPEGVRLSPHQPPARLSPSQGEGGRRPSGGRTWLVGGLLAGFALSTKYTLAGPAIGLGLLVVWSNRKDSMGKAVLDAARFTVVALIALAPWLVKNLLLDGNPFFPLVFPTPHFDAFDQQYYLRPGTGLPLWRLVIAPLDAAIVGREAGAPYGASTGALLVALLPTVLIGWRALSDNQRAFVRAAMLVILPAYGLWLVGNGMSWFLVQSRLLFPVFPLLALVGALGLEGLRDVRKPLDVGWLARSLVALVMAFALVAGVLSFVRGGSARVVLGVQSRDEYLASRLGWYHPAMQQLDDLPDDSRVLLLWEPRTFSCPVECVPDSLLNRWWHDRQIERDPLVIGQSWRDEGYTHILVHESGLRFLIEEEPHELLDAADMAAFDRLREDALEVVWQGGDAYTLYTWREGAADE